MNYFILIVLLFSSISSFTQERVGEFPPSRRYAPFVKEVDKTKFDQIVAELEAIYVKEDGLTQLVFETKWENSFTVAFSSHRDNQWVVYTNGGMARATHMTVDSFRLLLCHEVGHLIGGAPFSYGNRWAAVEGQADYFAASKCMKRVLKNKDNNKFLINKEIPTKIANSCESAYFSKNDQDICKRTSLAGKHLIDAFSYMMEENIPNFLTPDYSVISQTIREGYPSIQCRLDTIVSGALCDIDPIGQRSSFSAHGNACTGTNGDSQGLRPACWFNEEEFF